MTSSRMNKPEPPDSHEIDALESMECGAGWLQVGGRILEVIERRRDELERVPLNLRGPGGAEYLQGFIAACRMVLTLPEAISDEIKQQLGGK